MHSKFLLIDPLSDDPLVCSGSANFSRNSLINNDENMLLIRGDTRVADIYLTELIGFSVISTRVITSTSSPLTDRTASRGSSSPTLAGSTATSRPSYKTMPPDFPAQPAEAGTTWARKAALDPDPFADEQQRADNARKGVTRPPGSDAPKRARQRRPPRRRSRGAAKKAAKKIAKKVGRRRRRKPKKAKAVAKKKSAAKKATKAKKVSAGSARAVDKAGLLPSHDHRHGTILARQDSFIRF